MDVTNGAVPVVNGALVAGATQPRLRRTGGLVRIADAQGNECRPQIVQPVVQTSPAAAPRPAPAPSSSARHVPSRVRGR